MESCGMTFKPSGVVPTLLTSKPAKAERKEGTCQSHTPSVKWGLFPQGGNRPSSQKQMRLQLP